MSDLFDLRVAGRFNDMIKVALDRVGGGREDHVAVAALGQAYMGAGRYEEALPWEWRVHERAKAEIPDGPGEHLQLACAYWCLDDRVRAIELARGLCAGILDRSVNMAPDLAGGATYGLILHYMGVTVVDDGLRDYALDYLSKLNVKYDRRPTIFRYPVQTVKQLLGELSFEDALEGATKTRSLPDAYQAADQNRSIKIKLGIALFHDAVVRRTNGDQVGCDKRMREVFALGYQTESIRWYFARHEVSRP